MNRATGLLVATAAAAMLLTGCATESGTANAPGEAAPAGTNRPAETEAAEATAEPAPEATTEAPAPAPNPKFGETYTWENGLAVTVSAPEQFTPGEWAAKEDAPGYVKFTITVVNGTKENFDPGLIYQTVQSANTEASSVFDTDNGLEGSPSTTVLPGREVVFTVGYGVANPADLVMEINPGAFDYEAAIYTT